MDENAPLMLLDAGYVSIYRFFAVQKWYRMTFRDPAVSDKNYDWSQNKVFVNKYEELFFKRILKIGSKLGIPPKNILFAMDDRRDNIWRSDIYSSYKKQKPANFQEGLLNILDKMRTCLIPNLIKRLNVKQIGVEHLEADDIIAIVTRLVVRKNLFSKVVIITNDKDFNQLAHPHVTILNLQGRELERSDVSAVHVKKELQLHILMGDRSDNIPSCLPRRYQADVHRYVEDERGLQNLMNDSQFRSSYERNRILIDFDFIPWKYQRKVRRLFEKSLSAIE